MTQYSIKRNWLDINVSTSELKVLLAILLATKYNTLPRTVVLKLVGGTELRKFHAGTHRTLP